MSILIEYHDLIEEVKGLKDKIKELESRLAIQEMKPSVVINNPPPAYHQYLNPWYQLQPHYPPYTTLSPINDCGFKITCGTVFNDGK